MTTLSVSITPISHGNKVRGHILRMFWNEHARGASEAKQRRRNKANGWGWGGWAEGGPVRAEGTLSHSDEPEEDAICILNSPFGHCHPVGGPPRARVCSIVCPTLCDPPDCRPPGSSARGVSQARILEWGAVRKPPAAAPWTEPPGRVARRGALGWRVHCDHECSVVSLVSPVSFLFSSHTNGSDDNRYTALNSQLHPF